MFAWLRGPSKIDKAITAGDYPKAIALLREEVKDADPDDADTRHARQTLAELMGRTGQKEEAIKMLRELMNAYSKDNMHGKAVAIHKIMWDIDIKVADKVLEEDAKKMLSFIKPLDLVEAEDTSKKPSEKATITVSHTPIFGELTRDEVRAVVEGLRLQTKDAGDIVCVEGEPGDSLFILTDGQVRIHVRNSAGKTSSVRDLGDGSFFGEISVVYGKPRTATITCRTYCELLELDRATLADISKTHPGVHKVLKDFCDQRLQSAEEQKARKQ